MKRAITVILCLCLAAALAACSKQQMAEDITDMATDISERLTTYEQTEDSREDSGQSESERDTRESGSRESESSSRESQTDESLFDTEEDTAAAQQQTQLDDESTTAAKILTGKPDADTATGFSPLAKISLTAAKAPAGLSSRKISHSHGPASGGKAHYTVEQFQKTFDKYGALTLDVISGDKGLYLTFDCGWEHENLTSSVLDTLKQKGVKACFFCTLEHIKSQPELIARMIREGHIVANHSATHPSFAEISREKMASELEETENYLRENFGYAAKFFRFPAGEYTENALELVSSLGYTSVFWSVAYDDWDVNSTRGKDYAVGTVLSRLHDGAVILLHSVSRDNAQALPEIIDRARAEGYRFKELTEWPGLI